MGQLINAVGHHTDRSSHQILRNLARARACGCNLQHKRAENAERRLYQTIHRKDPNNYLFQRATHRRSSPSRTALSTGSAATASRMRVKALEWSDVVRAQRRTCSPSLRAMTLFNFGSSDAHSMILSA